MILDVVINNDQEGIWLDRSQDMLISLKMLVLQRAKVISYDSLAQKFDLKMLRALGMSSTFVAMHLFNL